MFTKKHSEETKRKISETLLRGQEIEPGFKKCCRCKATKPYEDFHRQMSRRDGRTTYCILCASEVSKIRTAARRAAVKIRLCKACGEEFTVTGGKSRNQLNCEKHRGVKYNRDRIRKNRKNAIFDLLGHDCNRCGFQDKRALQIDHVEGNGAEERREFGNSWDGFYKNILTKSHKYQILCANCNWIKRFENKEANTGDFSVPIPKGM